MKRRRCDIPGIRRHNPGWQRYETYRVLTDNVTELNLPVIDVEAYNRLTDEDPDSSCITVTDEAGYPSGDLPNG